VERDDGLRAACFLALDALRAQLGDELPYRGALDRGFASAEAPRVPFLSHMKGIYRAAVQRGPAALSVLTSAKSPYEDEETESGFLYDYRAGVAGEADNRALRAAHELQVPLVYFVGTRPGWYRPLYPCWVGEDYPLERRVLLTVGVMDPGPVVPEDDLVRRVTFREAKVRLDQARFRARVLPAYRERCTICSLKETRLLDAAHIVPFAHAAATESVSNGLSLCSIHHRAFDQHLVGVSPDYEVHVSRRLLEDDDGPMLDLLKGYHRRPIELPRRPAARPDRERLADRFDAFLERG
jgi:putative restriction endonuclease